MSRSRKRKLLMCAFIAVVAALVWRSFVTVDESELVLVTQFGECVQRIDTPGLHPIWPHRSVRRFDRRHQIYDPLPSEFLTSDPKNILLDIYVCWRILDPLLFLQSVTDQAGAEVRIHDIVWSEVYAEIGRRPLVHLVSDTAEDTQPAQIMDKVRENCSERIRTSFGVELVDVRLKRINLPEQNKQSVFDRMREERNVIARRYRAEGEEEAARIRADADRERSQLVADAERDAELCRGEAAKEAIRIYAAAHGKAPDFYQFLRSLDAYGNILDERATLVLAADSELFRYLADPWPDAKGADSARARNTRLGTSPSPATGRTATE